MKKAYLVLEDGQVFEGRSFGVEISGMGELVFSTGMCGYIETLRFANLAVPFEKGSVKKAVSYAERILLEEIEKNN